MGLLELGRWNVAECAVEALVVEPVHPLKGCQLDLVDVAPWSFLADQFGLVETGVVKVQWGGGKVSERSGTLRIASQS